MNALPSHYSAGGPLQPDDDHYSDRIDELLADPSAVNRWMEDRASEGDFMMISALVALIIARGLPRMDATDPRDVLLVGNYDGISDYLQDRIKDWAESEVEREAERLAAEAAEMRAGV